MKCPKCHYLSFEPEPRCRHCGHDFSVAEPDLFDELARTPSSSPASVAPAAPVVPAASVAGLGPAGLRASDLSTLSTPFDEVVLKRDPPVGAGPSLGLMRPDPRPAGGAPKPPPEPPEPRGLHAVRPPAPAPRPAPAPPRQSAPVAASAAAPSPPAAAPQSSELPLFVAGLDRVTSPSPSAAGDDRPRFPAARPVHAEAPVDVPAAPRPLAVRRPSTDTGRVRGAHDPSRRVGPLDRDLLEDLTRLETEDRRRAALANATSPDGGASFASRMAAGALDVVLLGVLNAVAIILTLEVSGLTMAEVPWTAAVPLIVFLWLVDLGYLLLFTVSIGQTVGKMALGLRVVDVSHDRPRETLTVGQAAYRSLLTFPSVIALGAGFLPALVGRGGAMHDRLTQTRVIRA